MRKTALATALLLTAAIASAADFVVTSGADSGPGSLRQAILEANQATDCVGFRPCRISFPPVEPANPVPLRINLASPLPPITGANIRLAPADDSSGIYGQLPVAEIRGPGDGLRIEHATNVTIVAVGFSGFPGHGVVINQSSTTTLVNVWSVQNGRNGLLIAGSNGTTIVSSRIDSNGANGIYATRSFGVNLRQSWIGTDVNRGVFPNAANGVHLHDVRAASVSFSSIRNNRHTGLLITGDSDDLVDHSEFENNGLLGIDIGADGPTAAGAPVIESALFNRGSVRISGSVRSAPNAVVTIETYVSDAPDPSGFGEGADFESSAYVTTDGDGVGTFRIYLSEVTGFLPLSNRYIAAIATGPGGTSEFSRAVQIVAGEPNFVVTNAGDAGPGSLREAIEQANASGECEVRWPCGILFEMAELTPIQPRTPLPPITQAAVWIDGGAQRVEINGSLCGQCNGLELHPAAGKSEFTLIRNLVINGFSGDGIAVMSRGTAMGSITRRVDGCYIGTDVTGTTAVPNGRGIYVADGALNIGAFFDNRIQARSAERCVISGNRGDAIVIGATGSSGITANLIGTDRSGFVPLGNGGGGIRSAGWSYAERNTIAFNGDRGVAVERPHQTNVLLENAIHSNRNLGIDIDDDGVTEEGAPEITSARVTDDGKTRITFRSPLPPVNAVLVTAVSFYAASFTDFSGRGEGRTYVGGSFVREGAGDHEFVIPMNLAGKYVSATATLFDVFYFGGVGTTSEFSRAVQVSAGGCTSLTPIIEAAYSWSALPGATEYRIWFMAPGDEPKIAYRGRDTHAAVSLPAGSEWWVEARFDPCYGTQSEHRVVPSS